MSPQFLHRTVYDSGLEMVCVTSGDADISPTALDAPSSKGEEWRAGGRDQAGQ